MRFTFFPVCSKCGKGNLVLMPKEDRTDPAKVFCPECQTQAPLEQVVYVRR